MSECEACTKNDITAVQPSEIRNQHQRSSAIGCGTQAQTNQVVEIMQMDRCHVYMAQVNSVACAFVILWRNATRNNDEPFLWVNHELWAHILVKHQQFLPLTPPTLLTYSCHKYLFCLNYSGLCSFLRATTSYSPDEFIAVRSYFIIKIEN